jgi:predicted cation transporter
MSQTLLTASLSVIMLAVLLLPFLVRRIEENLEFFLLAMGLAASAVSGVFSSGLLREALEEPLKITGAVVAAGLVFKFTRHRIRAGIGKIVERLHFGFFMFLVVFFLGLLSSVITAIIAALVLVEIISGLNMDRRHEVFYVVVACFSIGLGAALTPVGEPLSTILVSKLRSHPDVDFFFPMRLLGPFIIPGLAALGIIAAARQGKPSVTGLAAPEEPEGYVGVLFRGFKVYVFVVALVFLGAGFKPVIDAYLVRVPGWVLYWINMVSAILDNATLTAAEISPAMDRSQVRNVIMGLCISGGMLIPGNIPNIISANKLKIKSGEWARVGVPLGLVIMVVYFAILLAV